MTLRSKAILLALMLAMPLACASFAIIPAPVAAARSTTAAFRALTPARLLDTRADGGDPLEPGTALTVPVSGRFGIPADATAIALTVVATDTSGPGFVTLWGDGPRPLTSSLNIDAAGQTRANSAIIPLASDGSLTVFTLGGAHVILDVTGAFTEASKSSSGRLVTVAQRRVVDTRDTGTPFLPSEQRTVGLTTVGVPRDAEAAVISITGLGVEGFWSAYAAGTSWPGTASVNVPVGGLPATATAIVPLTSGRMTVFTNSGGDLVVDVVGYFTGPSASRSSGGLFIPVLPTRAVDTRQGFGGSSRLSAGTSAPVAELPFSPANAEAVAMNVTAVDVTAPGFLTVYPSGAPRPFVASANVTPGQVLAVGTLAAISGAGASVFSSADLDVVVDVTGYFTADPTAVATPAVASTASPADGRLPAPGAPPWSSEFGFLYVNGGLRHAQFDPCVDVTVRVNYAGAPSGARGSVVEAVRQLKLYTGLRLSVGDDTTARTLPVTPAAPTIMVRWSPVSEQPRFANTGVLGIGGGSSTVFSDGSARVVSGIVDVNPRSSLTGAELQTALLHELGHAVGLGHVGTNREVMNSTLTRHVEFQLGDRNGLYQLGSTEECASPGMFAASLASESSSATPEIVPALGDGDSSSGAEALDGQRYVVTVIE